MTGRLGIIRRDIGPATLYCGDVLEVLGRGDDDVTADALITDPPYSSGAFVRGDRMQGVGRKYVSSGSARDAAHNVDFSGDNRDSRSFAHWCALWMAMCHDRISAGGYAMVFSDWRQLPSVTDAFQAGGFLWRGIVPWDKGGAARAPHTGYFRHQSEFVVWGSAGPLPVHAHGGPWPGVIRCHVNSRDKLHMTAKPLPLMGDLVRVVPPGGVVLDPFMGSASTGIAALQLGYRFVGIEKSPHYFEVACRRVQEQVDALPVSAAA